MYLSPGSWVGFPKCWIDFFVCDKFDFAIRLWKEREDSIDFLSWRGFRQHQKLHTFFPKPTQGPRSIGGENDPLCAAIWLADCSLADACAHPCVVSFVNPIQLVSEPVPKHRQHCHQHEHGSNRELEPAALMNRTEISSCVVHRVEPHTERPAARHPRREITRTTNYLKQQSVASTRSIRCQKDVA